MVKVGNSECGFLKLTPLSRTSAMAGAVSRRDLQRAQAVRHEQDQVVGRGVLRKRRAGGQQRQASGQHNDGAAHEISLGEADFRLRAVASV